VAAEYRTALVTGASSGLGRGLCLWLARRGTRVYAAARREERLSALAEEAKGDGRVQAAGGAVEPLALDVADREGTHARVGALDAACGGLDLVVANAGAGGDTDARAFDWEQACRILDVNVNGAAATLAAALPGMVARGRGHLVGVSSLAGYRGISRNAAYSASKAFLTTFMESLRVDLAGTPLRVTCIHPGYVRTEMTAGITHAMPLALEAERAVELMGRAILRGRGTYGFPWPVAAAMGVLRVLPDALYDRTIRRFH
jgi:NADP-dependent 3-hydroxy acid dehydrogenase YdfG